MKVLLSLITIFYLTAVFAQQEKSKEELINENQKLKKHVQKLEEQNQKMQQKLHAIKLLEKGQLKLSLLEEFCSFERESKKFRRRNEKSEACYSHYLRGRL